jgi:hypothetical protein
LLDRHAHAASFGVGGSAVLAASAAPSTGHAPNVLVATLPCAGELTKETLPYSAARLSKSWLVVTVLLSGGSVAMPNSCPWEEAEK